MRNSSPWRSTAWMTAQIAVRKIAPPSGLLPGERKFIFVVPNDQLLCLPEPFTPLNGFSCMRQTKPWRSAVWRSTSMVSML